MNVRRFLAVTVLGLAAFPASARTLGAAVDAMDARTFAGVADVGAEQLELLHAISDALAASRAGVIATTDAEPLLVDLLRRAADPSVMPEPTDGTAWRAILPLLRDVIIAEVREQVLAGTLDPAGRLVEAVMDLGWAVGRHAASVGQRGSDGADNDCMTAFARCMDACANRHIDSPFEVGRAFLCALDCELDLADCLLTVFDPRPHPGRQSRFESVLP